MTNTYTIPFLINYIKGTKAKTWNNNTLNKANINYTNIISPIGGAYSLKSLTLNKILGGSLNVKYIVHGTGKFGTFGATPRTRLMKALKLVKSGNAFFL